MGETVETLISPEMAAAVGREYQWATSYPIAESDIRRWAVALYYPELPPRLYWDAEYAKTTRWGGIVAPEEFNPFACMRADPPGHLGNSATKPWPELDLGIPCPDFKVNIAAGRRMEHTKVRMRPGDVIRMTESIGGYHEKRGRLGLMLFIDKVEIWTNQRDEVVRKYVGTLIRTL